MTTKPQRDPTHDRAKAKRELIAILVGLASILVTRASFADHFFVPSGSMRPTVQIGDHIVVHKAAYGLRLPLTQHWITEVDMPARGDVVVLHSPETGDVLLKRVVAVAGDEVAVVGGQLWIDGQAIPVQLAQGVLREELGDRRHPLLLTASGGPELPPVVVPKGRLLVMGDHRGNSHDGRSFGFVATHAVLGRAVAVVHRHGALRWIDL